MTLDGGKRDRMVWYNLHNMVEEGLGLLGWLDDPVANSLPHQQVLMPFGGYPDDVAIPVNSIVCMPQDIDYDGLEIGSLAETRERVFIFDIFAESHPVGVHLRGDISAMLRGQLSDIGRSQNTLDVYDFEQATPSIVAVMDIENVRDDRGVGNQPWEKHWYSIMCVLLDEGWD